MIVSGILDCDCADAAGVRSVLQPSDGQAGDAELHGGVDHLQGGEVKVGFA